MLEFFNLSVFVCCTLYFSTALDERWTLMEDDLWLKLGVWWKTTLMEDKLLWNMNFGGRQTLRGKKHLMEDDLWWKTTYNERWTLTASNFFMKDDIWLKTSFHRIRHEISLCHTAVKTENLGSSISPRVTFGIHLWDFSSDKQQLSTMTANSSYSF